MCAEVKATPWETASGRKPPGLEHSLKEDLPHCRKRPVLCKQGHLPENASERKNSVVENAVWRETPCRILMWIVEVFKSQGLAGSSSTFKGI